MGPGCSCLSLDLMESAQTAATSSFLGNLHLQLAALHKGPKRGASARLTADGSISRIELVPILHPDSML